MRKNICVYCGASEGNSSLYTQAAEKLGKLIAVQERRLIYGGGNRGLMGTIANSVLKHGGEVIGIIPEKLVIAETAHHGITQLEIVDNMHQRKARMIELSDAFIAMPGGTGTLEELFETWTATQIGYHQKPVSLFNIDQFYDGLLAFLHHTADKAFIRPAFLDTLQISDDETTLLNLLDNYIPKNLERWAKA